MIDYDALADRLLPLLMRRFYVPATAYTPTYSGGTTAGTTSHTTQAGSYVRVGELVFVQVNIAWNSATGTGEARISLPFTSANVAGRAYSWGVWTSGITFGGASPQVLLDRNQAYFTLYYPASNAAPTVIAVEAAGQIVASGFYFIDP